MLMAGKAWATFYPSVLFQVILFGCLSFVGPSIFDTIVNLGGGGLSSPYLANLATTLNYACGFFVTLFGGPLINKLGINYSCLIAALAFPLTGSGYYVRVRYGIDAYLLAATAINGLTAGFLYVSSSTAMQMYPDPADRGFYLGIWQAMMNSGAVFGGAINLATNSDRSGAGAIAPSTYLVFLALECTGFVWASLLSDEAKVRRRDGSSVTVSTARPTWKAELDALWQHGCLPTSQLAFIPAFYSFFYGGTLGTYLTLHFSVRARALSSLITPLCTIPTVILYGKLLDMQRWSQRRRAWTAFVLWVIPQAACLSWICIEYHRLGRGGAGLDFGRQPTRWLEAYVPYLLLFTTGYWTQLSLYWTLGTFSNNIKSTARTTGLFRAFTTCGMAVSYAINSDQAADPRRPCYVNVALLVLALPCMLRLLAMVPRLQVKPDDGSSSAADGADDVLRARLGPAAAKSDM